MSALLKSNIQWFFSVNINHRLRDITSNLKESKTSVTLLSLNPKPIANHANFSSILQFQRKIKDGYEYEYINRDILEEE